MTLSEIAAAEQRIQSVCKVRTVLRQEQPKRSTKGTVKLICALCGNAFWTNPYRIKLSTKYCSKRCADKRKRV